MLGREVRLAEKDQQQRVGMTAGKFSNLVGGIAVTSADFAQILARHAIEPVNGGATVAGGREQFVKWSPIVAPVEFETDALAQFVFVNLAAAPFVDDVLVAGKNRFDSEHHGALVQFEIAEQQSQIALRVRQRVVVADQNDSRFGDFAKDIAGGTNF